MRFISLLKQNYLHNVTYIFNFSGVETWHGPQTKSHSNCKIVKSTNGGVDSCKKECLNNGCNEFTIDKTDGKCTLRHCSFPAPLPDVILNATIEESYTFQGIVNILKNRIRCFR